MLLHLRARLCAAAQDHPHHHHRPRRRRVAGAGGSNIIRPGQLSSLLPTTSAGACHPPSPRLLQLRARSSANASTNYRSSTSVAPPLLRARSPRLRQPAAAAASDTGAVSPAHSQRRHQPAPASCASLSQDSAGAAPAAPAPAPDVVADEDDLELVLQVLPSMGSIDARDWNSVAVDSAGGAGSHNPFVSHAFLLALEESGSAQPRTGWASQHLVVRLRRRPSSSAPPPPRSAPSSASAAAAAASAASLLLSGEGAVVGCAPVYLKGHSAGEYVFDHSWAEFHEQLGGRYYPKLLCGVPFTPVEGPRLMAGGPGLAFLARALLGARRAAEAGAARPPARPYTPDDARREAAAAVRRALASGLRELSDEYRCSGAHVNFLPAHEQAELTEALVGSGGGGFFGGSSGDNGDSNGNGNGNGTGNGRRTGGAFMPRFGWQYHWENRGYASFAAFEADLKQSRRKNVRQERKGVAKQGLSLRRRRGDELSSAEWDAFYTFYQDTVDRRWGTAYLTRDFFARLGGEPELAASVLMVTAHETGGGGGGPATAPGAAPADVFAPPSSSFGGGVAGGLASLFGGNGGGNGGGGKARGGASSLPAGGLVAAALNFEGGDCLYGRNWGAAPGLADAHPFLHFALCSSEATEAAIESGLARVEAGAQGEHKLQRGYLPALTRSAHLVRAADPAGAALEGAVRRFLRGEARQVSATWERLSTQASPFVQATTKEVVGRRAASYLAQGGGAVPWELARAAASSSSAGETGSSADEG